MMKKYAAAISLSTLMAFCLSAQAAANSRPNIVLILADDLGFSDLRSYGSEVHTPNIDMLANNGVRFSNYHTAASCAPTRAMLMSGVDSHLAGVANMPESLPSEQAGQPGYQGVLGQNVVTIANLLQDAGYHTYMTGKWHLGKTKSLLPSARGFDRALSMADSGADNWEQKPYIPVYSQAHWYEDGEPTTLPDDFYSSEYLIDKIIEYIDSHATDEPFFSYVAFQAVHIPVQAPREFTDKYMDTYNQGWSTLRQQRYAGAVAQGVMPANLNINDIPTTIDWASLTDAERRYEAKAMAVYAGMIDAMDYHLGRLMDHLRETGQFDNTVFIFASDNGAEPSDILEQVRGRPVEKVFRWWMDSNGYNDDYETLGEKGSYNMIGPSFASAAASPLAYYKFFTSEGGMRVPMIISGLPTKLNGGVIDAFTYVTDLVPTILDITQTSRPGPIYAGRAIESLSGKSLLKLVEGEEAFVYGPEEVVGFELGGNIALFQGDFKIVKNRGPIGDDTWHLYNIKQDPAERYDLATEQPARLEKMIKAYASYAEEHRVLSVADGYDQRQQVGANVMQKRFFELLSFIGVVIVLLFVGIRLLRRRSKAGG